MTRKILVAYASVSGSTGEVANVIADEIAKLDTLVEVCAIDNAPDVTDFDAVILGSSIRAGRWLPEAQDYLDDQAELIGNKPAAFFTTCLTMVNDSEDSRRTVLSYMAPVVESVPHIKPVGLGLFAGSLDPARQQLYALNPDLAPQGDYRDWDAIKKWASEIASVMLSVAEETDEIIVTRDALLSRVSLSGSDLHGVDLHEADLHHTDLSGADLHDADLNKSDLIGADLDHADLHGASLSSAALNWADMNWADMHNADLRGANLIGADLQSANLEQADLRNTILNGANLSRANLRGADLRYADLNWTSLNGADLRQAKLNHANLSWANFKDARLDQADLENACFNHFTEWPDGFVAEEQGATILQSGLQ